MLHTLTWIKQVIINNDRDPGLRIESFAIINALCFPKTKGLCISNRMGPSKISV